MAGSFRTLKDRQEAGRMLAAELARYGGKPDVVVLGLPRGGVVVAFEVAQSLRVPLDIFLVRKLGVPGQEELAAGAIASGGVMVLNEQVVRAMAISESRLDEIREREQALLERRERLYRGHARAVDLSGKQVIVIDDGLATGATMRTAVAALRRLGPARVIVAVPTAPADTCRMLAQQADEVVCPMTPTPFFSIGEWYEDFTQTSDEEVVDLLERARACIPRDVEIILGPARLGGSLCVPQGATGVVLFVHGSGSSRFSSRNRFVAQALHDAGLATLLFDLLSAEEERIDQFTAELRFDIGLLTQRVMEVTAWLHSDAATRDLKVGYFGASTGAAAALAAAARLGDVAAVVSRGGRPDLADAALPEVKAPTLLIVGGDDTLVVSLNRQALARLGSVKELKIVPGASHLFEEPGALEQVARLAADWFGRHLGASAGPAER